MRTIDDTTGPGSRPATDAARRGRAAQAGLPTIPLPRASAQAAARTARPGPCRHRRAGLGQHRRRRTAARAGPPGARAHERARRGLPAGGRPTAGSDVVGVLTSDAARLPLGCVLFRPSNGRPLVALPSGAPAEVGGGRIVVGDLAVSAAAWWNPRPKLPSLRPALLPEGVRQLRNALYGEGVPHSAFTLPGLPTGPGGPLAALRGAVRRADLDAALRTATRLIGLGPGLTPAGDDVMAGTIAGLVLLGHPSAERFAAGGLRAGRRPHDRAVPGAAAARRLRAGQRRVRGRAARAGRRAPARPGGGRPAGHRLDQRPGDGPGPVHRDRPGRPAPRGDR